MNQLPLFAIPCNERGEGWAKHGQRVAVVEVKDNEIKIRTGCMTSTPSTHVGIDNITNVVVWGDQPWNTDADSADDAHERTFQVCDPDLLKAEEVELFRDDVFAQRWFEGVYPPDTIRLIVTTLLVTKLVPDQSLLADEVLA